MVFVFTFSAAILSALYLIFDIWLHGWFYSVVNSLGVTMPVLGIVILGILGLAIAVALRSLRSGRLYVAVIGSKQLILINAVIGAVAGIMILARLALALRE